MEILYLLYIYFFAILTKCVKTQLVRKEKTCKRVQLLFPPSPSRHVDQICPCCCWILGGRRWEQGEKGMLLEKIKVKKARSLFFSLLRSLSPSLPSPHLPLPAALEFSLLENRGSNRHLNRTGGLGALGAGTAKSDPSPLHAATVRPGEPRRGGWAPGKRVSVPQTRRVRATQLGVPQPRLPVGGRGRVIRKPRRLGPQRKARKDHTGLRSRN